MGPKHALVEHAQWGFERQTAGHCLWDSYFHRDGADELEVAFVWIEAPASYISNFPKLLQGCDPILEFYRILKSSQSNLLGQLRRHFSPCKRGHK